MTESRIIVSRGELATTFKIWLTVIGQRRPGLLRDLWTRKGEEYDGQKIEFAREQLARELSERLAINHWQVTRDPIASDDPELAYTPNGKGEAR